MKIEIKVLDDIKKPYAVIYTNEINSDIQRIVNIFETENINVIPVVENERTVILSLDEIYMVRVEDEKTIVYTESKNSLVKNVFTSLKKYLEKIL